MISLYLKLSFVAPKRFTVLLPEKDLISIVLLEKDSESETVKPSIIKTIIYDKFYGKILFQLIVLPNFDIVT